MIPARRLAALALAGALCGCGATEASPGMGKTLIFARVKDAVVLDPSIATDGLSLNITAEVFANLVRFKPGTFDIEPDIAKNWHVSPDGKRWTFDLRPGLQFSDGTPVDAAAVKFNFDRWRLEKNPYRGTYEYGYYPSMFGGFPGVIAGVTVDAPLRVSFELTQPLGPFLRDIAMPSFAIGSPAAMKADLAAFTRKPVASGPYMVQEWINDDHITLVANPRYAGPKPLYDTVIVRDIPDQATSVLSLRKNEVDGMGDMRPDDATTLAALGSVTIYEQPSNNIAYIAMNMERKPFGDVRVRRAVAYALDLPGIVHNLYAKGAEVAGDWLPDGMLGSDPAMRAYPHDVARAKALLAEAGFPHGFSTQLYFPTAPRPYLPEPQRVAEAIQADLRAAGIDATLEPFEFGVFLDKIRNGEHPMCLIGWTGDNGDPDNFLYTLLDRDSAVKPNAQNYSFWRDPDFHALMMAGQRTLDDRKRAAIYRRAVQMVHDQAPAIGLVHTTVPFAFKDDVGSVIPRPDGSLNFELMRPR